MLTNIILNSRRLLVFIFPFLLGALSVLSFQPFNFSFINFFILPALFLIILYVNKKSKNTYRKKPYLKNFFFIGYFFGIGFFLTGTYWISYSLTFEDSFKFLIPFAVILIPLFLGLFFGLIMLATGPLIKKNFSSILFFCASLSVIDYLRSKILTGFPWNLWAYSWSWFPEIIQLLNITGLFAFNLLSITFFCSPLLFILNNKSKFFYFSTFILFFFFNYIYGSQVLNKKENFNDSLKNNMFINFKIVSPNFDLKYNLTESDVEESIKDLIRYSEPEENKDTIFIWPEGVFTGYNFNDLLKFKNFFEDNFSSNHLIILGVNTYDEKDRGDIFNSLLILNDKLEVVYKYNKKKLVPFGEFIFYEDFFEKFGLKKITQGYKSFTKGSEQKNFIYKNLNILPLICYEIIFPELTQSKKNNTNLIVNISEDAWFGGSIGPHQHFSKAIFRAIESDTYLIRSANKGFSAFIDNKGKVLKKLGPNETGSIELKVPIFNNNQKSRNDLIFFVLLFTYTLIFLTLKKLK